MDMRSEIENAARAAGIAPDELRLVAPHRYEAVLREIVERFTTLGSRGLDALWWWEALREPVASLEVPHAFEVLGELLPGESPVWFVAEDFPRTKRNGNFWLYEAARDRLPDLLREMFAFEYSVVSKRFEWLVAANHHGMVYAAGEAAVARLNRLQNSSSARLPTPGRT